MINWDECAHKTYLEFLKDRGYYDNAAKHYVRYLWELKMIKEYEVKGKKPDEDLCGSADWDWCTAMGYYESYSALNGWMSREQAEQQLREQVEKQAEGKD